MDKSKDELKKERVEGTEGESETHSCEGHVPPAPGSMNRLLSYEI